MRQIHCYKCGGFLGEIRDAKLKKDMYHVCGKCVRTERTNNMAKNYENPAENFFKGVFK
jgi:hypothetical protein